ncbi:MAG: hypothetical protein ACK4I0_00145 [Brevundimonas sp.]|uniref:hypothetical protein n=1 Tax=Brevundimonas sp. TaxID=1871086 RepID=UPI0039194D15
MKPAVNAGGYDPKLADGGQEGLLGIALWSPDAVVIDFGLKIEAFHRSANDYVE